ncbi:hypothetical protein PGT21_034781 [Puccinia graminis f. sp. tritici]|uniref:Uncharacterized protein n=1 Tax=Puccinia graminis f. sp. tritici TaxID=56615 RepID=A0A5B0PMW7_PUCGR|nr:hypothetical protein PGT21_034781 [Puccinia graminis f. sp. tritici]
MTNEATSSLIHSPAHDMDLKMFENLDDIADCNLLVPSNKPRLSDEHTHSINLDSDNPNSNEFIESCSSGVYDGSTSSKSDSSSSYSHVGSAFTDKDTHDAVNSYRQIPLPLLKEEGGQPQGSKVDHQAQFESLPTAKPKPSSQRHTASDSAPVTWESSTQLMKGHLPQAQVSVNTQRPDDLKKAFFLQRAQPMNRKRKMPVQVYTDNDKLLEDLIIYSQNLIQSQSTKDRDALRVVQDQIDAKQDEIAQLQARSLSKASRVKLGRLLVQKPDLEFSEREIYIFQESPDSQSVTIRLLAHNEKKGPKHRAKKLVTRINYIAQYLDGFDHLFSLLGLDERQRPGSGSEPVGEREVLKWFYELIFVDTQDHPPLMGPAELSLPLSEEQQKKYSPAQMILRKAFTQESELTSAQAAAVALKLRMEFDQPQSPMSLDKLVSNASSLVSNIHPVKSFQKEPVP